jgi:hypothetical protein
VLEPAAPVWFKQRAMSDDEREYLWKHFAFNAEQRLKAFHFFVVLRVRQWRDSRGLR